MPNSAPTATPWSVAKHDTIPQVDLWLNPLEGHTYLFAFLSADGEKFEPPYEAVRSRVGEIVDKTKSRKRKGQAPSKDVEDQRLRTWKATFESFGFFHTDTVQNTIRLSPLGRAVRSLYDEVNRRIEGANDHLATLGTTVLNRHLLYNPLDGESYPKDSDLRPLQLMWRAMRELDDKLHWEEMNRVIMWVNYRHQVDAAIKHIREVRKQCGGTYDAKALALLGNPAVSEGAETKRRITPWFTYAGFGGILISGTDDDQGYRRLEPIYHHLIDRALKDETPAPPEALVSKAAYLSYLTDQAPITPADADGDDSDIQKVMAAVERYGGSRIVCLSGIPGTGKSRLAKLVAARLADYDPYRFEEIQFHETTSYEDFMEGFVPRPSGEGFQLVRKTFRDINRRARLDPAGSRYVLLIEEFTRANVHSVLGELITYIEHRDRRFRLSLSQDEEKIAPNLVVMATMNPRDKSALVLDDAISRRLYRIPVEPSVEHLKSMLEGKLEATILLQLAEWFKEYQPVLPFGHGAFADARSPADLKEIWNGSIRYFLIDVAGDVRERYRELEKGFPWR